MADNIKLIKRAFNSDEFNKVIDRDFKTFTQPIEVVETDTVEELFRLYDKLYLDIPIEGTESSHEFLVLESSKLYKLDKVTEEIQPLLDEITQLRLQLVEANSTINDLESQLANGEI